MKASFAAFYHPDQQLSEVSLYLRQRLLQLASSWVSTRHTVLSHFWKSEVQNPFQQAETEEPGRLCSPQGLWWLHLLALSRLAGHSPTPRPSSVLRARAVLASAPTLPAAVPKVPPPPLLNTLGCYFGPPG